ncbi:hypothetical protein BDZ45DRAFT_740373 [Acephala macrosclerotiorum]|nr:hypothetical protein BDZ45DRAFT_740373 [Acephala macrosclerotiorum]
MKTSFWEIAVLLSRVEQTELLVANWLETENGGPRHGNFSEFAALTTLYHEETPVAFYSSVIENSVAYSPFHHWRRRTRVVFTKKVPKRQSKPQPCDAATFAAGARYDHGHICERSRPCVEMDPLSITTTCLGLVGTVAKTSIAINGFVRDVRGARSDLDSVSRELQLLKSLLELFVDDAANPTNGSFLNTLKR